MLPVVPPEQPALEPRVRVSDGDSSAVGAAGEMQSQSCAASAGAGLPGAAASVCTLRQEPQAAAAALLLRTSACGGC